MDQKHISRTELPPSAEELEAAEKRQARLSARAKETGVIVHVMSKYMGKRVHVEDTSDVRQHAFLAELFCTRYHQQFQRDAVAAGEQEASAAKVACVEEGWVPSLVSIDEVRTKTPMSYKHEDLVTLAAEVRKHQTQAIPACNAIFGEWRLCLVDRRDFKQHVISLLRLVWQSMCTTLLSRKVRTEEDIDDGTFTTVSKVQVANIFKRLQIPEDQWDASCDAIRDVLKMRIRDFKRIFAFYAASGDGPATSMDHCEYWKFVKDSKMQKDRKKMPSVRVDLIFQECNMDYSKQGKDRIEADDGELDPTEFIESLVRLASYRYTKGALPQCLSKLIDEDILPNACSVDLDVFRERLADDRVVDVFHKHKRNLKVVYKEFAADDDTDEAAMFGDTMNATELVSLMREIKLVGPLFSERSVRILFAYVQQEEELLDEDEEEAGDVGDSEMVYAEFVESEGAAGCWMQPDPYNVVDMRIDKFLLEQLTPACKALLRFRGKGLKELNVVPEK
jgi:hypothetical protein